MIAAESNARIVVPTAPALLRRAWSFNPTLVVFVFASAALLLAGIIGMLIDPRMVLGMPNWSKSTKFGISLGPLDFGLYLALQRARPGCKEIFTQ